MFRECFKSEDFDLLLLIKLFSIISALLSISQKFNGNRAAMEILAEYLNVNVYIYIQFVQSKNVEDCI